MTTVKELKEYLNNCNDDCDVFIRKIYSNYELCSESLDIKLSLNIGYSDPESEFVGQKDENDK